MVWVFAGSASSVHGILQARTLAACNAGDLGSIPGLGRSPGEGNGNLLQYSCLENCMDGGAWSLPPYPAPVGVPEHWVELPAPDS